MATITDLYNTATEGAIVGQATNQWIEKQLQSYSNFKELLTSILANDDLGYEDMTEQELLTFIEQNFPTELLNQRYAYSVDGVPSPTTISLKDIAYSYLWSAQSGLSPVSWQNNSLVPVDNIVEQIDESQEMLQAANQALLTIIDADANSTQSGLVSEYYSRLSLSMGDISDISANVGELLISSLSPALSTKDKVNGVLNMLGLTSLNNIQSLDTLPTNNLSGITGVNAWSALGSTVQSGLDAIKDVGSRIMNGIGSAINNVLGTAWTALKKTVGTVITTSDAYSIAEHGKCCFSDYGRALALYKQAYQDHLTASDIAKIDASLSNTNYVCFDALGSYIYIWRDDSNDRAYYFRILPKVIPSSLMSFAFGTNYDSDGYVGFNPNIDDDIVSYGKIVDNLFSVEGDAAVYQGIRNGISLTCHYLANIFFLHESPGSPGIRETIKDLFITNLFPQYNEAIPANPTNLDIARLLTNGDQLSIISYTSDLRILMCLIMKDLFVLDDWCPYFHTNTTYVGRYSVMTDAKLATYAFGACITAGILVTGATLGLTSVVMSKRLRLYKTQVDAYKRTVSKQLGMGDKQVLKLCKRADFKISLINSLIGITRVTSKTLLFGAPGLVIGAVNTVSQAISNNLSGSPTNQDNVTLNDIKKLISG